jgi:hypothetical protein
MHSACASGFAPLKKSVRDVARREAPISCALQPGAEQRADGGLVAASPLTETVVDKKSRPPENFSSHTPH